MGAAAALVSGLVFAGEPASNPSVVSFNGNASVEWGADLDAGKTGFKNGTWTEFKTKLFDAGDKATSGEGVWGEIVIKVDDDSSVGPNGYVDGHWIGSKTNKDDGNYANDGKAAYVDVAKLHFNNIYVGIKSGDTQTGELDFATAVRSGDPWFHPGRWLTNVGSNATQGIVAGYEDGNLNIAVDFRSDDATTQYTNNYKIAGEVALKDSNEWVNGLAVKAGASYNLSEEYYKNVDGKAVKVEDKTHILGYSASAAYKLSIDDKYYVKPMVGLTGANSSNADTEATSNANSLVASVLFGWGGNNSYGSAGGMYYFKDDGDNYVRGVTPGVSVLAKVNLPSTGKAGKGKDTVTVHDALNVLIVPSFYLGDLLADTVPGLRAAAYAEIGLYSDKTAKDTTKSDVYTPAANKDAAIAFVAGAAYDIKADDLTVTPKVSARYANASYMDNKTIEVAPQSGKSPLQMTGVQKKKADGLYDGDFFNLSAGLDVNGLIPNTTFYCNYVSANLLNKFEYSKDTGYEFGAYNVKAGTVNVGCQIHF